jgi:hypothetical protein
LSSQSIVSGQTKTNPGKITMGSPFSIRPAVAKLEDLKQRNHQLEPLRGRALEKTRRGSSARSNSSGDGPQIHSTNHRHNYG